MQLQHFTGQGRHMRPEKQGTTLQSGKSYRCFAVSICHTPSTRKCGSTEKGIAIGLVIDTDGNSSTDPSSFKEDVLCFPSVTTRAMAYRSWLRSCSVYFQASPRCKQGEDVPPREYLSR